MRLAVPILRPSGWFPVSCARSNLSRRENRWACHHTDFVYSTRSFGNQYVLKRPYFLQKAETTPLNTYPLIHSNSITVLQKTLSPSGSSIQIPVRHRSIHTHLISRSILSRASAIFKPVSKGDTNIVYNIATQRGFSSHRDCQRRRRHVFLPKISNCRILRDGLAASPLGLSLMRCNTHLPHIPEHATTRDMEHEKRQTTPGGSDVLQASAERNLRHRLPNISQLHRPSREELLAAATGFWSRLKVRFKWFSIRSVRPFNADEIGAFFSWVLLGHVLWIILGTTTFFSLGIFAVNTVFAQETLARWVGNYLTKSSGVKVVFESAIVPRWGDGVITFKNVFVSRRPGQGMGKVSKGSSSTAAAAAAANARTEEENSGEITSMYGEEDEDTNYTQFDVSLDTVNVTLSFRKWFNGKGLLRDVEVKGVRGVVDRTSVHYSGDYVDPRSWKHEHNPGDFEINSFRMEDLLVTIHQPHGFRPFSVSIFNCDLPQLRRQWLFYDILAADTMSGSFDNSLFTIHPRQSHGQYGGEVGSRFGVNDEANSWKKHSRLRIDGLKIDHLNRGIEGPFSWIRQGHVDIVADIMFPPDSDESITQLMSDFYDRMGATVTSNHVLPDQVERRDGKHYMPTTRQPVVPSKTQRSPKDDQRFLVMDLRVDLNDIRAAVPLFTKDLSYVNNALVRPIVAYMNTRKTFIPIHCRVVKHASEFDGSWTIFDSGLMDDLSAETYQAFAKDVTDDQARLRRFRKVGLWSLQMAAQTFFLGLAGSLA